MLREEIDSVSDRETKAVNFLKNKVALEKNIQSDLKKNEFQQEPDYTNIDAIITNFNNYFLLKVLSPQIKENENKKRDHKDIMLKAIVFFLKVQFILIFVLVFITLFIVFVFHGFHNDLTDETIKIIIGFLGVYISSIVVELIYIAKYIVVNVFDTSIDGFVELFSNSTTEKKGDGVNGK